MRYTTRVLVLATAVVCNARTRAGTVERVSVASDGGQANGRSYTESYERPSLSDDGRFVAFASLATNLVPGDTNGVSDVFIHDRQTGETLRVSVDSSGGGANRASHHPSISADGRWIAFSSEASNVVPGDTNLCRDFQTNQLVPCADIFVHDRIGGTTTRVSVSSAGQQSNEQSLWPSISREGRYVAFESLASNLVEGDTNDQLDVFVHDQADGSTTRVSVTGANQQSSFATFSPAISAEGRFVAFAGSLEQDGPPSPYPALYVRDREAAWTDSLGTGSAPSLSEDGRYVVFQGSGLTVVDRETRMIDPVGPAGTAEGYIGWLPTISSNGRFICFQSENASIVRGDYNQSSDVFVHDRTVRRTWRVSVRWDLDESNAASFYSTLSGDGRFAAYVSRSTNLVPADTNAVEDVFVQSRDLVVLNNLSPVTGSELGGDLVTLRGACFPRASPPTVWFGSTPVVPLRVGLERILVQSPPGSGVVDVAVSVSSNFVTLESAFRYVDPAAAARYGNVNAARGDRENVLLVNALAGEEVTRALSVPLGQRLTTVMLAPSSRASAPFVLFAWAGEPDMTTLAPLPRSAGTLVFPPPFTGRAPQPRAIWNNLGFANTLGTASLPSIPAPSIVFTAPHGAARPATITMQGLIADDAARIPEQVSVTNAVIVRIR
ncbi:MAG: PD40 domain-containing protein [Planctomycetes bacterium]|nr:PD40 domain-containing protein [Planctomycetota bacterium]